MALGADRSRIRSLVVWHGMRLAIVGVVLGIAAAFGLTRFISSFLFGVKTWDPLVFVNRPHSFKPESHSSPSGCLATHASRLDPRGPAHRSDRAQRLGELGNWGEYLRKLAGATSRPMRIHRGHFGLAGRRPLASRHHGDVQHCQNGFDHGHRSDLRAKRPQCRPRRP